jgi:hypothetical protein
MIKTLAALKVVLSVLNLDYHVQTFKSSFCPSIYMLVIYGNGDLKPDPDLVALYTLISPDLKPVLYNADNVIHVPVQPNVIEWHNDQYHKI